MDDLLAKLNDPAAWVVRTGVPVFGPHVKVVNGEAREVTAADLFDWCSESLALERQTGVAGLFRLGHIRTDLPDSHRDQPPTAGVYRNPRVADVRQADGQVVKRLLMDEWRSKKYAADVPEYPWRSVELYRDKKRITAVAALKRDPQLHDLGPPNLYHLAGPTGLELYALGGDAMDNPKPTDAPPTAPAAGALTPEEQAFLDKLIPMIVPKVVAAMQGAAAPPAAPPPAPEGMSRNASPEVYALEQRNSKLESTVKAMERRLNEQAAKAVLGELAAEHYGFDAAVELAAMTATDDAGRAKRAAEIRKYHGKVPADGQMLELFQGHAEPRGDADEIEEQRKTREATRIVVANPGMTFEAALRQVPAKQ